MTNIRERFLNAPLSHDNQSIIALARSGNAAAQAAIHCTINKTPGFFMLLVEAVKSHAQASGHTAIGELMLELLYRTSDIWREINAEKGVYFELPRRPDGD